MDNNNNEVKVPRRSSKRDRADILLDKIISAKNNGTSIDDAIGMLTVDQYDFLCDYCGNDLDNVIYTAEQRSAIKKVKRSPRPKGLKYKKKYPVAKQEVFSTLFKTVETSLKATDIEDKGNFRDLTFTVDGVKYKIVLSQPRK